MRKRTDLTAERLRELVHYDPETGHFTWRVWRGGTGFAGKRAGWIDSSGHGQMSIDGVWYGAHRLVWLYMTGGWPQFEIDHIDTVRSNNRWSNLRDVPSSVNRQNRRSAAKGSHTGLLGAYYNKRNGRYFSSIALGVFNGKQRMKYLGSFDSAQEAHEAFVRAKREYHEGCTL